MANYPTSEFRFGLKVIDVISTNDHVGLDLGDFSFQARDKIGFILAKEMGRRSAESGFVVINAGEEERAAALVTGQGS